MLGKVALIFLISVIPVFISHFTFGQAPYRTTLINSDKGLSQNSVYAFCKDTRGFIWIGTGDGLNRYDGKEFVVFRNRPNDNTSLDGFVINNEMYEDEFGRLWFSTERNLICFDQAKRNFQSLVPFGDKQMWGNKYIVSIDSIENCVWFIQSGFGLYSYDYVEKKFNQYEFPKWDMKRNPFSDAHGVDDGKGNIWVSAHDGLFLFHKNSASWVKEIGGNNFSELCMDSGGAIWLLNPDSLFAYDPQKKLLTQIKNSVYKSGPYYSMTPDDKGNVWVGTLDGDLFYGSTRDYLMHWSGNVPSLTGSENASQLSCLYYDPSGLIWIGTEGGGVVKFDLNFNNFKNFPSPESPVSSIYVKSLYNDADGTIWIGTFKKWIYLFNPDTREITQLPLPKNKYFDQPTGVVYSIAKDADGIYWIGYNGLLVAYNKKKQEFFLHPLPSNPEEHSYIINHIRVEKNYLLLSTINGVFKVKKMNGESDVKFKEIFSLAISESLLTKDGSLWVSSLYHGLMKITPEGKIEKRIASNTGIRCILEDTENKILWAATQSGLLAVHLPTGKSRFYSVSSGLLNPYLYGIVKTGHQIWVSSNRGLARGIIRFHNGNIFPEIAFKCFTKEAGLQSDEFNTGAYCRSDDGTIFFGGINGINWFKPEQIITNTHKPSVTITELRINDSIYNASPSVEYLKSITSNYRNNTFLIKFIGLEFHNPEGIHYRFRLEGLDKKWTEGKTSREVRYANLPPGNYKFQLFAINSDGVPSDELNLAIRVFPPFYKTWWFLTLLFTTITLLIVLITKYISQVKLKNRIRILEKEKAVEEERHRISKEMHDDLGAGLTQISLISEAAKRRNNNGNFPRRELNDIADTSKKLIENVSEIIWAMNPDFDTLSGMVAYLREQISKLLEYSGKKFKLDIAQTFPDQPISNIRRKNIIMLAKEAVNNAIKHSNATEVNVAVRFPDNRMVFQIEDNGRGFDTEGAGSGNGLKNFKYRTDMLGGSVRIHSGDDGTRVCFDIPLQ